MTGLLRDVLAGRAAGTEAPDLDLGRIIADGNHRIRRRRLGTVAIAAATTAVLAVAWAVIRPGGEEDRPAGSFTERRPTYATDSTIHYGSTTIDVSDHVIGSFIQTDAGFVFSTENGEVFLADGNDVTRIGDGDSSGWLAADDTGSLVGWADQAGPMTDDGAVDVEYVVYDTARGEEMLRTDLDGKAGTLQGTLDDPVVLAVDDGSAYVTGVDGVYRVDVVTGRDQLVKQFAGRGWLSDVARTWMVFAPNSRAADADLIVVNSNPQARTPQFGAIGGDLSPDGAHLLGQQGDRSTVWEVTTGKVLPMRFPGQQYVRGWHWLATDRFTALAPRAAGAGGETVTVDLISCSVTSLACTVVARGIATLNEDSDPGLRIPDGQPWEGGR